MEIEAHGCSFEYAKILKELGVKQISVFRWINENSTSPNFHFDYYQNMAMGICAFTSAELGQLLPMFIEEEYFFNSHRCARNGWWVSYTSSHNESIHTYWDTSEANARAKLLIGLIEKSIIKVPT